MLVVRVTKCSVDGEPLADQMIEQQTAQPHQAPTQPTQLLQLPIADSTAHDLLLAAAFALCADPARARLFVDLSEQVAAKRRSI